MVGRFSKSLALIFFILLSLQKVSAQESFGKTKPARRDTVVNDNRMDVIDVARWALKKSRLLKKHPHFLEFNPNKKVWTVAIPYPGYSIATGVAAVLPINISFYTDYNNRGQLSFFNSNFQYTEFKQVIAFSLSNIYFNHDKWELIGDWRFYNFPTYTYGLGTNTNLLDEDHLDYSQLRFYETIMRNIFENASVGLGYHLDYHWDISDFNAQQGYPSDFQTYGYTKNSLSSALSADFLYDSRNNANNPKTGVYFNVQFKANLQVLGSNSNWNSLILDFRKYFRIHSAWPMSMAFWSYTWLTTNGKPPYLDLPSTGWDMYNNTGRGYAAGRFRGLNMLYFESEFRFDILRNGLLGGVVFANIESLSQYPSNNFSYWQPGIGLGLRLKLNKRTNTNSAIDYGFGTGGSRGFAFNLNEVY